MAEKSIFEIEEDEAASGTAKSVLPDIFSLELPTGGGESPTAVEEDIFSLGEVSEPSTVDERAKRRETVGAGELFSGGFQRGVQAVKAIPRSFQAIGAEIAGNQELAVEAAQQAAAIEAEAPEALWELQNVRDVSDFGLWLVERLGENSVNLLAAAATGGVGGVVGALGARGLALTGAARQALIKAGAGVGGFAASMPLETSSTVREQFAATGSPQATTSLIAGTTKGLLELPTMFRLFAPIRATKPQTVNFVREVGKTALVEAGTELAQEEVDILARKYNDPSYSYFGGTALWRRAEAGVAGGMIGGIVGVGPAGLDAIRKAPDASGQLEGQRDVVPGVLPEGSLREAGVRVQGVVRDVEPEAEVASEVYTQEVSRGPVTAVRNMVMPKSEQAFDLQQATANGPREDLLAASPLLRSSMPQISINEMLDMLEADTPRYALVVDEEGKFGDRLLTDTDVEFVSAMALPQAMKPKMVQVDQQALQPAGITADVFDLPEVNSGRVWFLGTTMQEKPQLLELYETLMRESQESQVRRLANLEGYLKAKQELEVEYNYLISKGLRVVPSRGASFYYNGVINGREVKTPFVATGRSRAVTFIDLQTGMLVNSTSLDSERISTSSDVLPVAVDLNRFKPGEISAVPSLQGTYYRGDVDYWSFKSPEISKPVLVNTMIDLITSQQINGEWSAEGIGQLRELLRRGIYLQPFPFTRELITLEDVTSSKLVPGVTPEADQSSRDIESYWLSTARRFTMPEEETKVVNDVVSGRYLSADAVQPLLIMQSRTMVANVLQMKPLVDQILKQFGIDGGVRIEVAPFVAGKGAFGDANITTGVIRLFAQQDMYEPSRIFQILMHELGHIVSFYYYSRLPYEVQKQMFYAYRKALLVKRMGSFVSAEARLSASLMPGVSDIEDVAYYSTFVEWLAEQFRRWADSDVQVTTFLDQKFKSIARSLEQFYVQWERLGKKYALDMTQPDYFFSATMEYLRDFGEEKRRAVQKARQQSLYELHQDLLDSPALISVTTAVQNAIESLAGIVPASVLMRVNSRLDPNVAPVGKGAVARHIYFPQVNLNMIELATGSLKKETAYVDTRVRVAHELVHAYKRMGLMSEQEFEQLYRFAKGEKFDLRPGQKAALRSEAETYQRARNLPQDKSSVERLYEGWLKEEVVAYYIGGYANSGLATEAARPLLDRFLQILERIRNFVQGLGFRTRDDLLRAFFKGEMLERAERRVAEAELVERVADIKDGRYKQMLWDKVEQVGESFVATEYRGGKEGKDASHASYYWFSENPQQNPEAQPIGVLRTTNRMPKGFDIDWIESDRFFLAPKMIEYMERDLGVKAKPSGVFTEDGFKFMRLKYNHLAKYYVRHPRSGDYYSPNAISKELRLRHATLGLLKMRMRTAEHAEIRTGYQETIVGVQKEIAVFNKMLNKVTKDIWGENKHLLDQMFALPRNYERDEVQGSMIRSGHQAEENQLMRVLGEVAEGRSTDAFTAVMERKGKLEGENGVSPQVEVRNMREIIERVQGLETNEEVKKYLRSTTLTQEADRIGFFTRIYWGLHQLVWRNQHIPGLIDYLQFTELFNQTISRWHNRADEVARAWDQKNTKRDEISRYLFWAMQMDYLSPTERVAKIVRQPTVYERQVEQRRLGLQPDDVKLVNQIEAEFKEFLNEVEQVSIANIRDTVKDPVGAATAVMEVQAEMAKLRSRPYFPITRFGQYTVTVRDGLTPQNVLHFEAFDTFQERDAAVAPLAKQFPGDQITIGRVPEEMFEFMGLPAPLIRAIRESMPALTASQQAWLEDFERINLPDRSFRKHWLPRRGTPGYSMDGFRVYAHYFMHGSRYLARLKYGRHMSASVSRVRNTIDLLPNSSKRRIIVDYMTKHYNYIMESAKDWSKLKAFVALWQLGFSPAAAAMNFTQTPVVSWPFLAGTFGNAKGTAGLIGAMRALTKSRLQYPGGTGNFFAAWEEMQQQGRMDIGQAAELGSYANSVNLMGLLAGTKVQKFYRNASYYGMWMFQKAEEVNRKVMFKASWELAMQNPNIQRLKEIEGTAMSSGPGMGYSREIADLKARKGFTQQEAVAFIFAKEAIDQTQGIYAPYSRPAFMRKPLVSTLLIFYQFIQMMTYVYRYNPGTVQLMLVSLSLYGLLGLPGAEDLNEAIRFVAKKMGLDFDPQMEARKFVRDITRGTIVDEVGPDLFLHGISRYGFGLGLLPEGWALGKFDASANGSLGKLVPGMYESLHGLNTKQKPDQFVSDVMQRLSGAGFGYFFNLVQYFMENPGTTDSKKWETLLPRSARAIVKAARLYSDEAETTRQGARIIPFDVQDPEDLAALGFQALGFSPTKITTKWDLLREQRDSLQLYMAERAQLYGQMDRALQSGDKRVIERVSKAVQEYNEGVRELDPGMQISAQQLLQSLRNRQRARQLQELGLPSQRMQMGVAKRIEDLFPSRVRVEKRELPLQ